MESSIISETNTGSSSVSSVPSNSYYNSEVCSDGGSSVGTPGCYLGKERYKKEEDKEKGVKKEEKKKKGRKKSQKRKKKRNRKRKYS